MESMIFCGKFSSFCEKYFEKKYSITNSYLWKKIHQKTENNKNFAMTTHNMKGRSRFSNLIY
jgi:hypothetical protein